MQTLKESGCKYRKIATTFNVSPSTVQYHLNAGYKERAKARGKVANLKYSRSEKGKARAAAFMHTPAGQRSVSKSWIRNYLKHGYVTVNDVREVLKEFE
jgi:transposase